MITTLRKEAALIQDMLSGGSAGTEDSIQHDIRDIIMVYRQVMRDALKLVYYDRLNDGDRSSLAIYIATYANVPVEEDSIDDVYFSSLPSGCIELPHNKGIIGVFVADKPEQEIYPCLNPYVANDLPVAKFETNPWYYQEGMRLKFSHENWNDDWDQVNIKLLIPAPDTIEQDDPLPIIPNQMDTIRQNVIQQMMPLSQLDLLNDGNPNTAVNEK